MEEQGMSRSHRFSTSDLMALSSVPRAFEIFDETLSDEVRAETGGLRWEQNYARNLKQQIRGEGGYFIYASIFTPVPPGTLGIEIHGTSEGRNSS